VILDAIEDVGEVLEGVDAACPAPGHERVQARDACSALDVVDEEVVLAAERNSKSGSIGKRSATPAGGVKLEGASYRLRESQVDATARGKSRRDEKPSPES
jgi:hypothetical protein